MPTTEELSVYQGVDYSVLQKRLNELEKDGIIHSKNIKDQFVWKIDENT